MLPPTLSVSPVPMVPATVGTAVLFGAKLTAAVPERAAVGPRLPARSRTVFALMLRTRSPLAALLVPVRLTVPLVTLPVFGVTDVTENVVVVVPVVVKSPVARSAAWIGSEKASA